MHKQKIKEKAVSMWLNYVPFKVIKIELGISQTSIYRWAKQMGVKRPTIKKYNSREDSK